MYEPFILFSAVIMIDTNMTSVVSQFIITNKLGLVLCRSVKYQGGRWHVCCNALFAKRLITLIAADFFPQKSNINCFLWCAILCATVRLRVCACIRVCMYVCIYVCIWKSCFLKLFENWVQIQTKSCLKIWTTQINNVRVKYFFFQNDQELTTNLPLPPGFRVYLSQSEAFTCPMNKFACNFFSLKSRKIGSRLESDIYNFSHKINKRWFLYWGS